MTRYPRSREGSDVLTLMGLPERRFQSALPRGERLRVCKTPQDRGLPSGFRVPAKFFGHRDGAMSGGDVKELCVQSVGGIREPGGGGEIAWGSRA